MALSPRLRVLLLALVVLGALGALVWYLTTRYGTQPVTPRPLPQGVEQTTPTPATTSPANTATTPAPVGSPASSPDASASPAASPSAAASPQTRGAPDSSALAQNVSTPTDASGQSPKLLVPVAG